MKMLLNSKIIELGIGNVYIIEKLYFITSNIQGVPLKII